MPRSILSTSKISSTKYCSFSYNFGKLSHFGMAVLTRGQGVLKRNSHWPFCVIKVAMDVVPKRRSKTKLFRRPIKILKSVESCIRISS